MYSVQPSVFHNPLCVNHLKELLWRIGEIPGRTCVPYRKAKVTTEAHVGFQPVANLLHVSPSSLSYNVQ